MFYPDITSFSPTFSNDVDYAIIKGKNMSERRSIEVMERIGKMSETGRSFDVEFWQRQGRACMECWFLRS